MPKLWWWKEQSHSGLLGIVMVSSVNRMDFYAQSLVMKGAVLLLFFRESHVTINQRLIAVSLWHHNDATLIGWISLGTSRWMLEGWKILFCSVSFSCFCSPTSQTQKNNSRCVAAATTGPLIFILVIQHTKHQNLHFSIVFSSFSVVWPLFSFILCARHHRATHHICRSWA